MCFFTGILSAACLVNCILCLLCVYIYVCVCLCLCVCTVFMYVCICIMCMCMCAYYSSNSTGETNRYTDLYVNVNVVQNIFIKQS